MLLLKQLTNRLGTRLLSWNVNAGAMHCVKCVQIRSFFWSVFFRIRTENSVFGHFHFSQYYRRETLEMFGIPENIDEREVEGKCLLFYQNRMSISILQMLKHTTGLNQTTKARRQSSNFPDKRIRMRFVG